MKFYKINAGGVARDDGIEIQIKHADYLEYCDGEKSTEISIGFDPATKQIFVYGTEVENWSKPIQGMKISSVEKAAILENLSEGLLLLNGKFIVQ